MPPEQLRFHHCHELVVLELKLNYLHEVKSDQYHLVLQVFRLDF
jgi:hypothetical protein